MEKQLERLHSPLQLLLGTSLNPHSSTSGIPLLHCALGLEMSPNTFPKIKRDKLGQAWNY
eukprot:1052147-Amphidinium_carterae.1